MTAENQRRNVRRAASAVSELIHAGHQPIISHGNGPQIGLLALQAAAYKKVSSYPLDVLGAESEGMIGYMIEQELANFIADQRPIATLLTQVEVDPQDPAFATPSKPIGPVYSREESNRLAAERGWRMALDGDRYRRVVPSPAPKRVLEIGAIRLLLDHKVIVICTGGGGIPVVAHEGGGFFGVEAVIDKDRASALLARDLNAEALMMLTDVPAVWDRFGAADARAIHTASPAAIGALKFAAGSMGPKVEAARAFAETGKGWAAIGRLDDAMAILSGTAGTRIDAQAKGITWYVGTRSE